MEEAWELCELLGEYEGSILVKAYYHKEEIRAIFKSHSLAEAYARQDMILDRKERFANAPMAKALSLLGTKFDKMVSYL